MKMPPELEAVIWDFNGTLIDDVEHIVRSVNVLLQRRALPLLTVASFRDVFGFPIVDYYRKIGFDLSAESMADLSAEFHDEYVPGLMTCPLHEGVVDALATFRKTGARQFVLSALEEVLLGSAIDRLGIADCFEALYGLDHLEGDSKLTRARSLLDDFRIPPNTALLIGDTDHDAEVAEALSIEAALVATGHQSERRLHDTGCAVYGSVGQLSRAFASRSREKTIP